MFSYCQTFISWMFNGASQSVIDFFSVVLCVGVFVLALLPICLIVKYVFKR